MGLRDAPRVPCTHDADRACTQLRPDGGGALAFCTPDICSGSLFRLGSGPSLAGELVGDAPPEAGAEGAAGAGARAHGFNSSAPSPARAALHLTYHCTSSDWTTVTLVLQRGFYDPLVIRYRKRCRGWAATPGGVILIAVVALLSLAALALLLLRMRVLSKLFKRGKVAED